MRVVPLRAALGDEGTLHVQTLLRQFKLLAGGNANQRATAELDQRIELLKQLIEDIDDSDSNVMLGALMMTPQEKVGLGSLQAFAMAAIPAWIWMQEQKINSNST